MQQPKQTPPRARSSPATDAAVPVAEMVESIVGCKWSMRLLELLAQGCNRPSALLRACPGLSAKVMNERLRKLTRYAIAQRIVRGEKPPIEVDYVLSPFGLRFLAVLDEVRKLQAQVDAGALGADERA
jgi:DNA-binding HxlR family transcriptional regulator